MWKPVPGLTGVSASEDGRIRVLSYQTLIRQSFWRTIPERITFGGLGNHGYMEIRIQQDTRSMLYLIHRLIALTFIPNPMNKPEVNHKDGNKTNNMTSNLEWTTESEQRLHAYRLGLQPRPLGSRSTTAILCESDIPDIRKRLEVGESQLLIAIDYGVNRSVIGDIKLGRTWKHVL